MDVPPSMGRFAVTVSVRNTRASSLTSGGGVREFGVSHLRSGEIQLRVKFGRPESEILHLSLRRSGQVGLDSDQARFFVDFFFVGMKYSGLSS